MSNPDELDSASIGQATAAINSDGADLDVSTGDTTNMGGTGGSPGTPYNESSTPASQPEAQSRSDISPLGQLMAAKVGLGLDNSLPKDIFGNPIYNAMVGPYGAVGYSGAQSKAVPGPLDKYDPNNTFVPLLPEGVSIRDNVEEAHKNGSLYWLYNKVKTNGPWDYKQQDRELYESGGNFNYGVVAEAAGVPDWLIMRAPGIEQIKNKTSSPDFGKPWGGPPYGDDPKDQYWIQRGRDYYKKNFKKPEEENFDSIADY